MSEDTRATLMVALWFLSTIALVALFVTAAAMSELTSWHILLAFIILMLAITGTIYFLRLKVSENPQEKSKNRRMNTLLRDLSEDDLVELKHRLADLDSNEDPLLTSLGDDGEIVRRR